MDKKRMGRKRTHVVRLTAEETKRVKALMRRSGTPQTLRSRAQILLALDENRGHELTYRQLAASLGVSESMVSTTVRKFSKGGLEEALTIHRHPNSDNSRRKIDANAEAEIIRMACSDPPDGCARWTMRLLEEKLKVVLEEPVGKDAICRTLKKNEVRPHLVKQWCLPPNENGAFVAAMEDVLDVYHRPYDPKNPVVCMDELPFQMLDESRPALEMRPGNDKTVDYEYQRKGTASIFMFVEPLGGWRHVAVRKRRTAIDWAHEMKALVDDPRFKEAEKITIILDNLNTHVPGSLYKAFHPKEARRILDRVEFHHTPVHGSWLNVAECELSVLSRQCLARRVKSIEAVEAETASWESNRNEAVRTVKWQFTTGDARIRLASLYPTYEVADPLLAD